MSTQDNASGSGNFATRTSSGGLVGQTSDTEQIAHVAETIMRESGSEAIRVTIEPVPDNDPGTSDARRRSSRAGAAPAPRANFVSSTSSGGTMGVSAPRAESQTDSAPANVNGDTAVNGNSNSTN